MTRATVTGSVAHTNLGSMDKGDFDGSQSVTTANAISQGNNAADAFGTVVAALPGIARGAITR